MRESETLYLIPESPWHVTELFRQREAERCLALLVPLAQEVGSTVFERIEFVDCGAYWQCIRCPACNSMIEDAWFKRAFDSAYEAEFASLLVTTECCGTSTSFHELKYDLPMGYARYALEAREPGLGRKLTCDELHSLERALGCSIREIWAAH